VTTEPTTELDARYSSPGADAVPWSTAEEVLETAPLSWVTTVRADGSPHVTPLLTVWADGALHFCTGPEEQKARNLAGNPNVALSSAAPAAPDLHVVVEGVAVRVLDEAVLTDLATRWAQRHGPEWAFGVGDGAFTAPDQGVAHVFAVRPRVARGFGTTEPFTQTRWTFPV
jgi:hypothetical protein